MLEKYWCRMSEDVREDDYDDNNYDDYSDFEVIFYSDQQPTMFDALA